MSSKRQLRRRACLGKIRYPDVAAAYVARRRQAGFFGQEARFVAVYRCRFGNHWHLGRSWQNRTTFLGSLIPTQQESRRLAEFCTKPVQASE